MQYLSTVITVLVFFLLIMWIFGKVRQRRLAKQVIIKEVSPPIMGNFNDYDDGIIAVRKKKN